MTRSFRQVDGLAPPFGPGARDVGVHPGAAAVSLGLHGFGLAALVYLFRPTPPAPAPAGVAFSVVFAQRGETRAVSQARIDALADYAALAIAPLAYAPRPPGRVVQRKRAMAPAPAAPRTMAMSPPGPAAHGAPASATETAGTLAALESRIRQAVNDAKFYPPAARQMRRQGRAAISFAYRDGGVRQVMLAQTSRIAMLDIAALEAVRRAHYPKPPAELAGETLSFRVWVDFSLVAAD